MKRQRVWLVLTIVTLLSLVMAACGPQPTPEVVEKVVKETVVVEKEVLVTPTAEPEKLVSVYGIYATELTEPWDQAIHRPLLALVAAGLIKYAWSENLGYGGELEPEMERVIAEWQPDLLIGDAFGNESAVRRVAAAHPEIAFAFGSAEGSYRRNLFTFDNENQDGSRIAGWIAGTLTESGVVAMVLGKDCAEVNRLGWGFIQGAQEARPDIVVLTTYIDSWYDPAKAEEHAWSKIEAGADVLYCERVGCEQAAAKAEGKVWVIGQMVDSYDLAPDHTITSIVWDMGPTVEYVVGLVQAGPSTWQDKASYLGAMSRMGVGGTHLAPIRDNIREQLPPEFPALVGEVVLAVMEGKITLVIEDSVPGRVPE